MSDYNILCKVCLTIIGRSSDTTNKRNATSVYNMLCKVCLTIYKNLHGLIFQKK